MNKQRATWAQKALNTFMADTDQEEVSEAIGDLICDLLHLAAEAGLNPKQVHREAMATYEGEVLDDE
ncbi:MAG: hypothetical protein ACXWYM_00450 [Candidatus Binatia bacterium]